MEISLSPFFAKLVLYLNPFDFILVVCKGYDDDYGNFTELVWKDDKYLDFYDKDTYPEYRLWVNSQILIPPLQRLKKYVE